MKVVFILNSLSAPIGAKRVNEFLEQGYEVEVYGFSRKLGLGNFHERVKTFVLGEILASTSYCKRLPLMVSAIRNVLEKYKKTDVIYYLFQLDVALAFRICANKKCRYIYEEPDLMHTHFKNQILRKTFEIIDKDIIKKSLLSVFTSEGFLEFHYKNKRPDNICLIPNKLNSKVIGLPIKPKSYVNNNLKIGFVGMLRYDSIRNFIKVVCEQYNNVDFYVYGKVNDKERKSFNELLKYRNYHFEGAFSNPDDFPKIYANIDLVLASYDVNIENVKYAEPNKIYEAIYFETPIIVSKGTFLENRVKALGIGYSVDAMDEKDINGLMSDIINNGIKEKVEGCKKIPKTECINKNDMFFELLKNKIN